jgi:hypothetical protein
MLGRESREIQDLDLEPVTITLCVMVRSTLCRLRVETPSSPFQEDSPDRAFEENSH